MEPQWDGFRLLVAIDQHGRVRAWSRRGASLGDRLSIGSGIGTARAQNEGRQTETALCVRPDLNLGPA